MQIVPPVPWQPAFVWGHLEGLREGPRDPPCALGSAGSSPSSRHSGALGTRCVPSPVTSPVGRHFQAEGHLEVHELLPVLQHLGDLRPQALLLLLQGLHRQLRAAHREGVRGVPALPVPARRGTVSAALASTHRTLGWCRDGVPGCSVQARWG